MYCFNFKHGLAFQQLSKEHHTCRFLFKTTYKNLGFFDINIYYYYLKKIAKILNFFYIKNLKIQILFEDFLVKKYRYFWKNNTFFSKFLKLNFYNKIRLTSLKHFQTNLNYFTKKNKFYSGLNKLFFKNFLKIKEKFFKTRFTQTLPDLLILSNPLNTLHTNQALLRQIPTILFTDALQNLNNYTFFIGINTKTEIKLTLFLSLLKKIMQFFFFNKNLKILFWKFYLIKAQRNKSLIKVFFNYSKKNQNIYINYFFTKKLNKKLTKKKSNSLYNLYFKIFKRAYIKRNLRGLKNIRLKMRYKFLIHDPLYQRETFKKSREGFKTQRKFLYKQQKRTRLKKKKYLLKHLPNFSMFIHKKNN